MKIKFFLFWLSFVVSNVEKFDRRVPSPFGGRLGWGSIKYTKNPVFNVQIIQNSHLKNQSRKRKIEELLVFDPPIPTFPLKGKEPFGRIFVLKVVLSV